MRWLDVHIDHEYADVDNMIQHVFPGFGCPYFIVRTSFPSCGGKRTVAS